jgi:hypothetical protein
MMTGVGTSYAKFDVMKFDGTCNFGLWQQCVMWSFVYQNISIIIITTRNRTNLCRIRL